MAKNLQTTTANDRRKNTKNKVVPIETFVEDEFVKNIFENVKPKNTLILGISGGADSVYLLHRFLEIQKARPELQLKLIIAHLNHGLRAKDSDTDEKFVKNLAKKNGIKFLNKKLNLKKSKSFFSKSKNSGNLEEAGREARYDFFEQLRKRFKANWIVTAHHLNDNIETMLFNLIRGAHLSGIKAMEVTLPSRHLLRPMLGLTKQEILDYLEQNHIEFRTDATNDNTDFSRNWLRHKILPLFPKLNANFEQTFKETLKNLAETSKYLDEKSLEWLNKNTPIELDKFLSEHHVFQKQLLVQLYKKIHGSTKKLTTKHLNEILQVLNQRKSNTKKEFGPKTMIEVVWDIRQKPQKSAKTSASNRSNKKRRYIRLSTKK